MCENTHNSNTFDPKSQGCHRGIVCTIGGYAELEKEARLEVAKSAGIHR